jgi:NTE family protein
MRTSSEFLRSHQVGLALSGGAVRGLAHIGVIKALDEVGIKPSVVAGTSVGSIIGAAIAAGRDWREIAEMARAIFWPALLRGKALEQFCADHLPETFEDLKLPFAAVSTIVPTNRAIAITSGSLASAISASCAVRLLRRPVIREGLRLKDGGFSCVLPTQACQKLGANFLIASDVWEWSSLMRSLCCSPATPWTSRVYPSQYRFALSFANIHIHPKIPAMSYVPGAGAVDRMIAIGECAAHRALEQFSRKTAA